MRKTLTIAVLVLVALVGAFGANAQNVSENDVFLSSSEGPIAQTAWATTYSAAATAWHYGSIINCRKIEDLSFGVTVTGCGATSYVSISIEWLLDDPSDPRSGGPYDGVSYTAKDALSGVWVCTETLPLLASGAVPTTSSFRGHTTSHTLPLLRDTRVTTNVVTVAGNYIAHITPKAPYCRLVIYHAVADTSECTVGAWWWARVRQFNWESIGAVEAKRVVANPD
jgi:hypothetical protein